MLVGARSHRRNTPGRLPERRGSLRLVAGRGGSLRRTHRIGPRDCAHRRRHRFACGQRRRNAILLRCVCSPGSKQRVCRRRRASSLRTHRFDCRPTHKQRPTRPTRASASKRWRSDRKARSIATITIRLFNKLETNMGVSQRCTLFPTPSCPSWLSPHA